MMAARDVAGVSMKPCPTCGDNGNVGQIEFPYEERLKHYRWVVHCFMCGLEMTSEQWNTRPIEAQLAERLEAAEWELDGARGLGQEDVHAAIISAVNDLPLPDGECDEAIEAHRLVTHLQSEMFKFKLQLASARRRNEELRESCRVAFQIERSLTSQLASERNRVVDVVFDGPPSHESGRFVEVEDENGCGVAVGEWIDRGNGYWALRFRALLNVPNDAPSPLEAREGEK